MELQIISERAEIRKLGVASIGVIINKKFFLQVIRSDRYNVFLENGCIIIGDAEIFKEDKKGNFFNTFSTNGILNNKIILTKYKDELNLELNDSMIMYSDFQTYIKLKKCDIIK